jgi:hypothetical protein
MYLYICSLSLELILRPYNYRRPSATLGGNFTQRSNRSLDGGGFWLPLYHA